MNKVIIEFDTSEGLDDVTIALKARLLLCALADVKSRLRATYKHDAPVLTLDEFYQILGDHDVNELI